MVKINDKIRFVVGIVLVIMSIYLFLLPGTFFIKSFMFLFSTYFLVDSVLENKAALMSVFWGILILLMSIISLRIDNLPLMSVEVIFGILLGLSFIVTGIGVISGHLSGKWVKLN